MSVKVTSWVWQNSNAKGPELLVLLAIADSAEDDGTNAWPRVATLAKKTRIGQRSVIRHIARLQEIGELKVTRTGRANRYSVIMKGANLADQTGQGWPIRDATGGRSDAPTVASPNRDVQETSKRRPHMAPAAPNATITALPLTAAEEALAGALGWNLDDLTTKSRTELRRCIRGLPDATTPDEIRARAGEYRRKFTYALTPTALARHWPSLAVETEEEEFQSMRITEVS